MLRAFLTGTHATGGAEATRAHGLGITPDAVALSARGTPAGVNVQILLGDTGDLTGSDSTNIYMFCTTNDTNYSAICMVWQGRSY